MVSSDASCNDSSIEPIALAAPLLLHLLWVGISMARLSKVARQMLLLSGSSVGKANMVSIVEFMRAGHWRQSREL